jgi:hypothetical protein
MEPDAHDVAAFAVHDDGRGQAGRPKRPWQPPHPGWVARRRKTACAYRVQPTIGAGIAPFDVAARGLGEALQEAPTMHAAIPRVTGSSARKCRYSPSTTRSRRYPLVGSAHAVFGKSDLPRPQRTARRPLICRSACRRPYQRADTRTAVVGLGSARFGAGRGSG